MTALAQASEIKRLPRGLEGALGPAQVAPDVHIPSVGDVANNFHDINGLLLVGIEPHFALLLPGVPIPFIPTPMPRLPKLNFLHPFVLGDQQRPTVHFNGVPAVGHWHQPKFLWPHLGLPPFPFDILTPLQVLLGVQTCWLPKTDVYAEGTPTTPCAIYGPMSINLDCWELGNFPSSLVIQPGTVQTTPTFGDYMAGLKAVAVDFAINLVFNALFLGAKHIVGAGFNRLARSLANRAPVRRVTSAVRSSVRRAFQSADDDVARHANRIMRQGDAAPSQIWDGPSYRGDSRTPDQIRQAGGFFGHDPGGNISLETHMLAKRPPSQWVSASQVEEIGEAYAWQPNAAANWQTLANAQDGDILGYNYVVNQAGGVNTLQVPGITNTSNLEVAFSEGIPWSSVEGWRPVVMQGGTPTSGPFVPNVPP